MNYLTDFEGLGEILQLLFKIAFFCASAVLAFVIIRDIVKAIRDYFK